MKSAHLKNSLIILFGMALAGCFPVFDSQDIAMPAAENRANKKHYNFEFVGISPRFVHHIDAVAADLQGLYGEPVYKGKVIIKQIESFEFEGKANNLLSSSLPREVLVSTKTLYSTSNFRSVMAHELYHVLYQSPAYVKTSFDITLEGEAELASYRIRYPKKGQGDILKILEDKLRHYLPSLEEINLEAPFHMFSDSDRRILYAYGAYLVHGGS